MSKLKPECMRCGYCCRGFFAAIPKNETSNLSEDYLDQLDYSEQMDYIDNNSELMGSKCKWLYQDNYINNDNKNDIAKCNAYERRSSHCRNYNFDKWCNMGLMTWKRHKDKGNEIPEEIMEIIKNHPRYKMIFK